MEQTEQQAAYNDGDSRMMAAGRDRIKGRYFCFTFVADIMICVQSINVIV